MTTPKGTRQTKSEGGIQSISRAFALLENIADSPGGIGLTQLSRNTTLNISTVFHLLKTMRSLGYVRQLETTKKYEIGSGFLRLAAGAQSAIQLASYSDPILRELASATGNTALFGIPSGDEVIVVARAEGDGAFQMSDRIGDGRPNHCTAMGKLMLANMSAEKLTKYFETYKLKGYTRNTITESRLLKRELDDIRQTGLAFDDAEFHPDLRCIAATVRGFTGSIVGALAVSSPTWRLPQPKMRELSSIVRSAADRLSNELGYSSQSVSVRASNRVRVKRKNSRIKTLGRIA